MTPLTMTQVAMMRELRAEGLPVGVVAERVGCAYGTVCGYASKLVENDGLRAAFESSGLSACELARELGWYSGIGKRGRKPDASRVRRTLGITGGRRRVNEALALQVASALGVDPGDVGI